MSAPSAGPPVWQQPLLPGELREDADGRRSARDWLVDVAMYVLAVGIGAIVLAETWKDHGRAMVVVDVALGVVALVAMWWRRSRPVAFGVIGVLCATFSAFANGPGLFALFNAAIRAPRRALAAIAALSLMSAAVFPLVYRGEDSYVGNVAFGALLTGVVIGWGLFVRARRVLIHSLRERAERLEAEQRLHVEQAREAERRRIAGEMHDVLAHRLSLLSVHAGALEFRPDAPPEEIAQAAGVIRATARAALSELREVIGVLRDTESGDDGVAGAPPEPPQPTLAQIPALVDESRAAGLHVRCTMDAPDADSVPAALGRTAYRVVQEGLTNARKHAPNAAVDVSVTAAREHLVVEVRSRRPVGVPATARPGDPLPGAGSGLIGLAERVALAGGELEHGPDASGDFVLRARLPRGTG